MRFHKLRIAWSVGCVLAWLFVPPAFPQGSYGPPLLHWLSQLDWWQWAIPFLLLAVVPWLPHRFSLRTLLIATTLIAVVLGAIVYATR